MNQRNARGFFTFILSFAILLAPTAPAFALGELPPVETPPAPPVVDLCPNIDGAQASIPGGMILDGSGNCVTPPPTDTTPPVISLVVEAAVTTIAANVTWVTNELSVSTFEYGTSQSYGSSASISASLLIGGTAVLTGLMPSTTYYYCIHATDASNNTANSCGHSFTTASTPAPVDVTAPSITLVTVAPIAQTSATVTWTSNEVASAQVEYGTTAGYGSSSSLDTNLALTHSVALSGLTANTTYHYRVKSTDNAGNQAVGPDETFTTSAVSGGGSVQVTDTTPPVVSEVGSISIGTSNATLGWTTNELAVSTLEYGTSQSYGTHPIISTTALLAHTVSLTGLSPNTTYYYCIHDTDLAGNTASSCPHSFTTDSISAPVDTTAPIVSVVVATPVGSTGATVSWTTNELANAQVQYGLSTSYGTTDTLDPILALTHSNTLTGLTPSTLYHYRVKSADDSGNIGYSTDGTFTTGSVSQAQVQAPAVISNIQTGSVTTGSANVTWTTNLPSDSQIEYGINSNFGTLTTLDTNLTTSHSVTILGLAENTNYIFRIKSKATGAVTTVSNNYEFNTLAQQTPQTTPAVISGIASSPSSTAAIVTWTTDKTATTFLEYGITTTYGLDGALNSSLATSHTESLTDLEPSTTYHYRVISVDADGNTTTSSDHTFTTSAPVSGFVNAPASATISVSEHGDTYATISWNVSSALVDTAAEYDIHYSTQSITEQNFESTHAAQEAIIGYEDLQPSGTSRTYTIVGLDSNTKYYFAIKSKFQASSWSAISNNPSVTTLVRRTSSISSGSTNAGAGNAGVSASGGGGGVSTSASASPSSVTAEGNDSL
jgi:phosphodiesterase/alkaline phosphatase D-like protein